MESYLIGLPVDLMECTENLNVLLKIIYCFCIRYVRQTLGIEDLLASS